MVEVEGRKGYDDGRLVRSRAQIAMPDNCHRSSIVRVPRNDDMRAKGEHVDLIERDVPLRETLRINDRGG